MSEENYEIVRFIDGELELEVNVNPKEETIWLSQIEIAKLFGKDRKTITRHIQNILKEFELNEKQVCSKKEHTALDGKKYIINIYNLDMIIAIGYRVKSLRAITFRQWANKVLREYLVKGYVINESRTKVTEENFNNLVLIVNDIKSNEITTNKRLLKIEDKLFNKEYILNKIFYNGQFYDSYTLIQSIFESANNEIIIIDNYIDRSVLDRLVVKKSNVKIIIYTCIQTRLLGKDIDIFNKQYGNLEVKYTTKVHDRYIVIDQAKLYLLGHSIKDIGKKVSSISELDKRFIDTLINSLKKV